MRTDYLVYAHTRLNTNEVFYIGKGTQVRIRKNSDRNIYWRRIVKKDGGFNSIILAGNLTEKEALNYEILIIKKAKDLKLKLCNMTDGGDGVSGYKRTLESRQEQSKRMTGVVSLRIGHKASKETVEKMRMAKLGKKQTPEHIAKCRAARIGRIVSEETRKKLSISNTGKVMPKEFYQHRLKPVMCINTNESFESVSEAARRLNLSSSVISRCCLGIFKQAKGYFFRYITPQEMTS